MSISSQDISQKSQVFSWYLWEHPVNILFNGQSYGGDHTAGSPAQMPTIRVTTVPFQLPYIWSARTD